LGNSTVVLAGVTQLSGVGTYVLYPVGYSSTGLAGAVGAVGNVGDLNRLDWTVPPTAVIFQSGVATAGISTTMTVNAVLHQEN